MGGRHDKRRAVGADCASEAATRRCRLRVQQTIRQVEERHGSRRHANLPQHTSALASALGDQPPTRPAYTGGMRRGAVGDDDDLHRHAASFQAGHHSMRTDRLVVRMRRDNEQTARHSQPQHHRRAAKVPAATAAPTCIRCASGDGWRRYIDRSVMIAASGCPTNSAWTPTACSARSIACPPAA